MFARSDRRYANDICRLSPYFDSHSAAAYPVIISSMDESRFIASTLAAFEKPSPRFLQLGLRRVRNQNWRWQYAYGRGPSFRCFSSVDGNACHGAPVINQSRHVRCAALDRDSPFGAWHGADCRLAQREDYAFACEVRVSARNLDGSVLREGLKRDGDSEFIAAIVRPASDAVNVVRRSEATKATAVKKAIPARKKSTPAKSAIPARKKTSVKRKVLRRKPSQALTTAFPFVQSTRRPIFTSPPPRYELNFPTSARIGLPQQFGWASPYVRRNHHFRSPPFRGALPPPSFAFPFRRFGGSGPPWQRRPGPWPLTQWQPQQYNRHLRHRAHLAARRPARLPFPYEVTAF